MFGNLIEQLISSGVIKKVDSTSTPTNNDLNNSPRYVDINQPRTAQFAGANVDANTYGKEDAQNILRKIFMANKGGEISKGRKEVKNKFGHEGAINPKKAQITKLLKSGGEVLAKGNKIAKHRPTKLY